MKRKLGQPVSDSLLLATARIVGSGSAAAQAIAERDRRRAAGEDAHVFWDRDRGILNVGPMPDERGAGMSLMFPKPQKPARGGRKAELYMAAVRTLPCLICGVRPVEAHHPIIGRFSQRKASDFDVIPLCPGHHRMVHEQRAEWVRLYGYDSDLVGRTQAMVERMEGMLIGGRT